MKFAKEQRFQATIGLERRQLGRRAYATGSVSHVEEVLILLNLEPSVGKVFMVELIQTTLSRTERPLDQAAVRLIEEGRRLKKEVNCFDFVGSNYENAWNTLDALPRGRFCEWGSGLGVIAGLAEILGFEACGIEQDLPLSLQSRKLLESHGLRATIHSESYFESEIRADIYYVYCWPSSQMATDAKFAEIANPDSLFLACYGSADIRGFRIEQK